MAYSSRLRPLLTWRPNFLTFNDQRARACAICRPIRISPRWLDRMGIDFDVVTDHDLHEKGVELLAPTRSC